MKVRDLNEDQKGHLAWRLNTKTGWGMSAARQAATEMLDTEVSEIFRLAGCTKRSAQAHARLVGEYVYSPEEKKALALTMELLNECLIRTSELDLKFRRKVCKHVGRALLEHSRI